MKEQKKVIHVPHGHAVRIFKNSRFFDGVYGDKLINAVMLIVKKKNEAFFMYLDARATQDHIETIKKIVGQNHKSPNDIYFFYRDFNHHVNYLCQALLKHYKFVVHQLTQNQKGVLLKSENFDIELKKNALEFVDNLIDHPEDQKLTATFEVDMIAGMRCETEKLKKRPLLIFNGYHWLKFPMFKKEELTLVAPEQDYLKITNTINKRLKGCLPPEQSTKLYNMALYTAHAYQAYLNDFDPEKLFERNLKTLLNCKEAFDFAKTPEEKKFLEEITNEINSENFVPRAVFNKIVNYKLKNRPQIEDLNNFFDHYQMIYKRYQQRIAYNAQKEKNKKIHESAKKLRTRAIQHYKNKKYDLAHTYYKKALKLYSVLNSNKKTMASAYYNAGKSALMAGKKEIAKPYFKACLAINPKHEKAKSALQEYTPQKKDLKRKLI